MQTNPKRTLTTAAEDLLTRSGKGKEDCIYIVLLSTHTYSQSAQTWITQFYLQITPCLPFLRDRSPDGTTTATEAADIQLQLSLLLTYQPPKG